MWFPREHHKTAAAWAPPRQVLTQWPWASACLSFRATLVVQMCSPVRREGCLGVTRTHCQVHLPHFHQYACASELRVPPRCSRGQCQSPPDGACSGTPAPQPPAIPTISPALPHMHPLQISSLSASSPIPHSRSMPLRGQRGSQTSSGRAGGP